MSFNVLNRLTEMSYGKCFQPIVTVNGKEITGCTAPKGKAISFSLKALRTLGVLKAYLIFTEDGCADQRYEGKWQGLEDGMDIYSFGFKEKPAAGLYFYGFELHTPSGVWYVAEDGSKCRHRVHTDRVLVYNEKYKAPTWLDGGIIYHIFVDRFCKGEKAVPIRDDVVMYTDWENGIPEYPEYPGAFLRNNTFFGGTLWGVIDKLPYLKELGVSCIYLSPVFKAYSNHKYDTGDYMQVDEMFGGDEALEQLFIKAKEQGIGVILDGVFNHVGDDSLYFDHFGKYGGKGAYSGKKSPYYKWFSFIDFPDVYEAWWGIGNLPRVNRVASFRKLIYGKGGVVEKYMGMGASGFRLDVVDELERDFTEGLCAAVKRQKEDAYMVGEVWEDASDKIAYDDRKRYFQGKQLDAVMNYPLRSGIIEYALWGNAEFLADTVNTLYRHYPPHKTAYMMNVLGTHDTERILTVLGGDRADECTNAEKAVKKMSAEEYKNAVKRLKIASLLQMTLPGIPCVYYGDEAGMEGYKDPFNRRPFPWHNVDEDIYAWYKKLTEIRRQNGAFTSMDFKITKRHNGVFAFVRGNDDESVIVITNMGSSDATLKGSFVSLLTGKVYEDNCTVAPFCGDILLKSKK